MFFFMSVWYVGTINRVVWTINKWPEWVDIRSVCKESSLTSGWQMTKHICICIHNICPLIIKDPWNLCVRFRSMRPNWRVWKKTNRTKWRSSSTERPGIRRKRRNGLDCWLWQILCVANSANDNAYSVQGGLCVCCVFSVRLYLMLWYWKSGISMAFPLVHILSKLKRPTTTSLLKVVYSRTKRIWQMTRHFSLLNYDIVYPDLIPSIDG